MHHMSTEVLHHHHAEYVSYEYDIRMPLDLTYQLIGCVGSPKQRGAAKTESSLAHSNT
jgi:hypothetical protein